MLDTFGLRWLHLLLLAASNIPRVGECKGAGNEGLVRVPPRHEMRQPCFAAGCRLPLAVSDTMDFGGSMGKGERAL